MLGAILSKIISRILFHLGYFGPSIVVAARTWSGEFVVSHLEVASTWLLRAVNPEDAYKITKVSVKKLRVLVPWRNLYSQSVSIEVEGVEIVVEANTDPIQRRMVRCYSNYSDEKKLQSSSSQQVQHRRSAGFRTFFLNIVDTIVGNAQVTLQDVKVVASYEGTCFPLLGIGKAQVFSTNSTFNGKSCFDPNVCELAVPYIPHRTVIINELHALNYAITCNTFALHIESQLASVTISPTSELNVFVEGTHGEYDRLFRLRRWLAELEWRSRRVSLRYLLPASSSSLSTASVRWRYAIRAVIRQYRVAVAQSKHNWRRDDKSIHEQRKKTSTATSCIVRGQIAFGGSFCGKVTFVSDNSGLQITAESFGVRGFLDTKLVDVRNNSVGTTVRACAVVVHDTRKYVQAMYYLCPLDLSMPSLKLEIPEYTPPECLTIEDAIAFRAKRKLPSCFTLLLEENVEVHVKFDANTFVVRALGSDIVIADNPQECVVKNFPYTGSVVNVNKWQIQHFMDGQSPRVLAQAQSTFLHFQFSISEQLVKKHNKMTTSSGEGEEGQLFPQITVAKGERLQMNFCPDLFASLLGGIWEVCLNIWYPFGLTKDLRHEGKACVSCEYIGQQTSMIHSNLKTTYFADREFKRLTINPTDMQPLRFFLTEKCTYNRVNALTTQVDIPNYTAGIIRVTFVCDSHRESIELGDYLAWVCDTHDPVLNDDDMVRRVHIEVFGGFSAKLWANDPVNTAWLSTEENILVHFDWYHQYPEVTAWTRNLRVKSANHDISIDSDFYFQYWYYRHLWLPRADDDDIMFQLTIRGTNGTSKFDFDLDEIPELTAILFDCVQVLSYENEMWCRVFPDVATVLPLTLNYKMNEMIFEFDNPTFALRSKYAKHRANGLITTVTGTEKIRVVRSYTADEDNVSVRMGRLTSSLVEADFLNIMYRRPNEFCRIKDIREKAGIAVTLPEKCNVTFHGEDWAVLARSVRWIDFWEKARPGPATAIHTKCHESCRSLAQLRQSDIPLQYTYSLAPTEMTMLLPASNGGEDLSVHYTAFCFAYRSLGFMTIDWDIGTCLTFPMTIEMFRLVWSWVPNRTWTMKNRGVTMMLAPETIGAVMNAWYTHIMALRFDPHRPPLVPPPPQDPNVTYAMGFDTALFTVGDGDTFTVTNMLYERIVGEEDDGTWRGLQRYSASKVVGTDNTGERVFFTFPTNSEDSPPTEKPVPIATLFRVLGKYRKTTVDLHNCKFDATPTVLYDMMAIVSSNTPSRKAMSQPPPVAAEIAPQDDMVVIDEIFTLTSAMHVNAKKRIRIQGMPSSTVTIRGASMHFSGPCGQGSTPEEFSFAVLVQSSLTLRFENITLVSEKKVHNYVYLEGTAKIEFGQGVKFLSPQSYDELYNGVTQTAVDAPEDYEMIMNFGKQDDNTVSTVSWIMPHLGNRKIQWRLCGSMIRKIPVITPASESADDDQFDFNFSVFHMASLNDKRDSSDIISATSMMWTIQRNWYTRILRWDYEAETPFLIQMSESDLGMITSWLAEWWSVYPKYPNAPKPSTMFHGKIENVCWELIDDSDVENDPQPFLHFTLGHMMGEVTESMKDRVTTCSLSTEIKLERFDKAVSRWEPITENVELAATITRTKETRKISAYSQDIVGLNVTAPIAKCVSKFRKIMETPVIRDMTVHKRAKRYTTIAVHNFSSENLVLLLLVDDEEQKAVPLAPCEIAEIPVLENTTLGIHCGSTGLRRLQLHTLEEQSFFLNDEVLTAQVIADSEGQRVLKISSLWRVKNMCGYRVKLKVESHSVTLPHIGTTSLPHLSSASQCEVSLRPRHEKGYSWSEPVTWPCDPHTVASAGSGGRAYYFHVFTKVEPTPFGTPLRTLVLLPAMRIRNYLPIPFLVEVAYSESTSTTIEKAVMEPSAGRSFNELNSDRKLSLRFHVDPEHLGGDDAVSNWLNVDDGTSTSEEEFLVIRISSTIAVVAQLIRNDEDAGAHRDMIVYVPYWVENNSPWSDLRFCDSSSTVKTKMFAPGGADWNPFRGQLRVRKDTGAPSSHFNYDVVGADQSVVCVEGEMRYHLAINVSIAAEPFSRTKIIRCSHQYEIRNSHTLPVKFYSKEKKLLSSLEVSESRPFVFPNSFPSEVLATVGITFSNMATTSKPIDFNELQLTKHRIVDPITSTDVCFRLHISMDNETSIVIIKIEVPTVSPYSITNQTFYNVVLEEERVTVMPFQTVPFFPRDARATFVTLQIPQLKYTQNCELKLAPQGNAPPANSNTPVDDKRGRRINARMIRTQTVLGKDNMIILVSPILKPQVASSESLDEDEEVANRMLSEVVFKSSFGISFVDSREIAYMKFDNVTINYARRKDDEYDAKIAMSKIQIDNCLPLPMYDVVFCAGLINSPNVSHVDALDNTILFALEGATDSVDRRVQRVKKCEVKMAEYTLRVEDSWLGRMHALLQSAGFLESSTATPSQQLSPSSNLQPKATTVYLFIEDFSLYKTIIHLSYIADTDLQSNTNPFLLFLKSLGCAVQRIEDASLRISGLHLKAQFGDRLETYQAVRRHLRSQTLQGLYQLLGALEVIGNPIGLLGNVRDGVTGVFTDNVGSLGRNLVFGTVGMAKGITSSFGQGFARLTFDDKFISKRRRAQAKKAKNFGEGVVGGAKAFGVSVGEGITGIVMKPVEGAQESGVGGFFKGLGIGLVGVVAKPVTGVLDLVSHTTEGLQASVVDNSTIKRRARPPRVMVASRLVNYERDVAQIGNFLSTMYDEIYAADTLELCFQLSSAEVLACTDTRLLRMHKEKGTVLQEIKYGMVGSCLLRIANTNSYAIDVGFHDGIDTKHLIGVFEIRTNSSQCAHDFLEYMANKRPDVATQQWVFSDLMSPNEQQICTVYESERYTVFGGWSMKNLAAGEPYMIDTNGVAHEALDFVIPPAGCDWVPGTKWEAVTGWEYGPDCKWNTQRTPNESNGSVRVRIWKRPYAPQTIFHSHVMSPKRLKSFQKLHQEQDGFDQAWIRRPSMINTNLPTYVCDEEDLLTFTLYENQRYYLLGGWSTVLMPLDPPHWTDETMKTKKTRADVHLPEGFEWHGDWVVDRSNCDGEGFEYAIDFWAQFTKEHGSMKYVRRKKWVRQAHRLFQ